MSAEANWPQPPSDLVDWERPSGERFTVPPDYVRPSKADISLLTERARLFVPPYRVPILQELHQPILHQELGDVEQRLRQVAGAQSLYRLVGAHAVQLGIPLNAFLAKASHTDEDLRLFRHAVRQPAVGVPSYFYPEACFSCYKTVAFVPRPVEVTLTADIADDTQITETYHDSLGEDVDHILGRVVSHELEHPLGTFAPDHVAYRIRDQGMSPSHLLWAYTNYDNQPGHPQGPYMTYMRRQIQRARDPDFAGPEPYPFTMPPQQWYDIRSGDIRLPGLNDDKLAGAVR